MVRANRLAKALAAAAALGLFGVAQAQTTINNGLTPGVQNLVQDESRETYVDVNRNGLFDTGDVIFGFIQIQNFAPSGALAGNAVYGVFSQQVTSFSGTSINFGATTVAGLTLQALTGNAAAPAGSIASFYDNAAGYSTNLITTALAGATSMKSYIDFITGNGTLRLTAALSRPSDFLVSGSSFAGAANSNFIGLPSNVTVASTGGGLTVVQNNTNFSYASNVTASSPPGYAPLILDNIAQLGISAGTVSGSANATPIPQVWLNADYGAFNFQQCSSAAGADIACGFIDKNDFGLAPIRVPEPGSLLLVSGALLGLAGVGRRRKDKGTS
jgi:hypothetical protein